VSPPLIVAQESHFVLNRGHPDFKYIKIGAPVPFAFDPEDVK
jgi:hypothetical protein